MKTTLCILVGLISYCVAVDVNVPRHCAKEIPNAGLSPNYYENVAHAVHSMTVQVGVTIILDHTGALFWTTVPYTLLNSLSDMLTLLRYAPPKSLISTCPKFLLHTLNYHS